MSEKRKRNAYSPECKIFSRRGGIRVIALRVVTPTFRRVTLAFLSDHFQWDEAAPVGELELVNDGISVEGTLILMSEWKTKLPAYL